MKINKMKVSISVIAIILISAASAISIGIISFKPLGLCYGKCDEFRETQFRWKTAAWLQTMTYCDDINGQAIAFGRLFPELSDQVVTANSWFATLAEKEKEGTLTLNERERYLDSPLRVHSRSSSAASMRLGATTSNHGLVSSCPKQGFDFDTRSELTSYCSGRVFVGAIPQTGYRAEMWNDQLQRAYARLNANKKIDDFLEEITHEIYAHRDALRSAEAEIKDMPITQFTTSSPSLLELEISSLQQKLVCWEFP